MHRLRNKTVLYKCIEQGVEQGAFGYAAAYDDGRYDGLRFAESMSDSRSAMAERNLGFLVRPGAAARQKEAERTETPTDEPATPEHPAGPQPDGPSVPPFPDMPAPGPDQHRPRRIVARKRVLNDISLDDINLLRDEIIRNLSNDGGEITVEITVSASKPEGFSEGITRSVRENGAQLGVEIEETQ